MIRPQTGQKIPADFFGQLYDMVISSQVRGDGKTISVKRTPSGTTISVLKPGGGKVGAGRTSGMFVIQEKEAGVYAVIDIATPGIAGVATINGQFYTVALTELAITAPAYILMKYTMPTEAGAGDTAEIISSASLLTSDGEFAYYLIGRIYNDNGRLAISQDHQPGNLIMWWQGPCWSE